MSSESQLLLYGVFRRLIEHNVPLGISDYLDALRALQLQLSSHVTHPLNRESLRRLCQILWARSPEETRLIDSIFAAIPPPPIEDVDAADALLRQATPPEEKGEPRRRTRDRPSAGSTAPPIQGGDAEPAAPAVRIDIQSPDERGGIRLPYPVLPAPASETFVTTPQSIVSSRTLAVLWRRYRRMVRSGPRIDLDLNATIVERSRRGVIDRPILRSPRVNRARLLILADVSPSMAPWRPFLDALAQSMALSRLPAAEILYFANVPKRTLFRSTALSGGVPADAVFDRHGGAGLLIISDAGAARGYFSRQRLQQTAKFLAHANRARAVVWINPMPRPRWRDTTADHISADRNATFLPLDIASLIRAVDVLRGAKAH